MPTIAEVRAKYPQYDDMPDDALASALHSKFYADMPRADFDVKIGLAPVAANPAAPADPKTFREFQQRAATEDNGALRASTTAGLQGATLGFGDELIAGLMTPVELGIGAFTGEDAGKGFFDRIGDAYGRNVDLQRAQLGAARENHPVASTVGEIGGGLALGKTLAPLSPLGNSAGAGVGARILAGTKEGAAYGGAYGFGSGEGLSDSLADAAGGAVMGGLVGGAIPAVAAGVRTATKPIRDAITARTNPGGYAAQKVVERLGASNMSLDQAATRLAKRPGSSLADEAGSSVRDLLRTATNVPGPARDRVTSQLTRRAMGQGGRLKDAIRRTFADPDGYLTRKDELIQQAADEAGPLYEKARKMPVHFSEELEGILGTNAGKSALRKAEELASNEQFPFQQIFAKQMPDGTFQVNRVPDMRGWDYIKRAMDDMVGAQTDSITKKVTNEGRVLVGLKNRMLSELDKRNPYYGQARAAFAGPKTIEDAMEVGRRALREFSPEQVERVVKKMSSTQKEAARIGAAEAMRKQIDDAGFTHNAILKIFNNRSQARTLRALFDNDKAYTEFTRELIGEARKRATYEAVKGNSTTVRQSMDMMDAGGLGEQASLATAALASGPVGAALQWVGGALRRVGGLTPKVADEIAKRLMTSDPAAVRNVVSELTALQNQNLLGSQKQAAVQAIVSRALTSSTIGATSGSR